MDGAEGQETWRKLEMVTSGLAQDLCEQLRLILEPSQASRLKVMDQSVSRPLSAANLFSFHHLITFDTTGRLSDRKAPQHA